MTETIYGNQNPAPRAVPARPDHSGSDQAARCEVDGDLLEGTFRNQERAPALVMALYDTIRLRTPKGTSGKNGGCS